MKYEDLITRLGDIATKLGNLNPGTLNELEEELKASIEAGRESYKIYSRQEMEKIIDELVNIKALITEIKRKFAEEASDTVSQDKALAQYIKNHYS